MGSVRARPKQWSQVCHWNLQRAQSMFIQPMIAILLLLLVQLTSIGGVGGESQVPTMPSLHHQLDCDTLSVRTCFCETKSDRGSYGVELVCPNAFIEVHNITFNAVVGKGEESLSTTSGKDDPLIQLYVKCNPWETEVEMQWELLNGLNLSDIVPDGYMYKLKISSCPVQNTQTMDSLLNAIGLPKSSITRFGFELSRNAKKPNQDAIFQFISTLTNLKVLQLNRIPGLTQIPPLANLKKLEELHLKENSIQVVQPNQFQFNQELVLLDLSFNEIQALPTTPAEGAGAGEFLPSTLKLLDLNSNNLQHLESTVLSKLVNLKILSLRHNPNLTSINYNAFTSLRSLEALDLDYTKFQRLPDLSSLQTLKHLTISFRDNNPQIFLNHSLSNYTTYGDFHATNQLSNVFEADYESAFVNLTSLTSLVLISDGLVRVPLLQGMPKLKVINLSANQIGTLNLDAFSQLPELTDLDLSLNQIIQFDGINAMGLKMLNLEHNFVNVIGKNVFSKVGELETLKMGNNWIERIDARAFEHLSKLRNLDLSRNRLQSLSSSSSSTAAGTGNAGAAAVPREHDDISSSSTDISAFLENGFDQSVLRYCTKLQILNLAYNGLQWIYDDWKLLFMNLSTLDLSHNHLQILHSIDINFITIRPLTLDLSSNNISTVNMDNALVFLEADDRTKRSIKLKLAGNPLNCDCQLLSFYSFNMNGIYFDDKSRLRCTQPDSLKDRLFMSLTEADLVCNYEDESTGCPTECDCWKIPYNKTIVVDCSYRRLVNFIPNLRDLKAPPGYKIILNLTGNGLRHLYLNHTQNITSNVVEIDISSNELNSLAFLNLFGPEVNNELDNNGTKNSPMILFNLAQNNFACDDCELHRLLKRYFKQISDYKSLTCHLNGTGNANEFMLIPIEAVNENDYCAPLQALSLTLMLLAIFAGILFAITGVLIIVYMKHGWAIRAFLYSKGYGGCFFLPDDDEFEQGKVYDAFVSYSHKDEAWVISQLVTRLEEEEGFKLCLHYRDWTPGDWIPEQIVQSVDSSKRTLIILSKNFVESMWSRLEFKAAHSQALNEKSNRLILILVGDDLTDSDIQDEDLRIYMKMNTYLKWSDPWLWHKLKFALPHKKRGSNVRRQQQHERAIQLDKLRSKIEENNGDEKVVVT